VGIVAFAVARVEMPFSDVAAFPLNPHIGGALVVIGIAAVDMNKVPLGLKRSRVDIGLLVVDVVIVPTVDRLFVDRLSVNRAGATGYTGCGEKGECCDEDVFGVHNLTSGVFFVHRLRRSLSSLIQIKIEFF